MFENPDGRLDPYLIRFSQASVRRRFADGSTINDLAEGLRTGNVRPEDIPPVRLVEREGILFTLDNRRLEAFRRAGMDVPYRMASDDEAFGEIWKFTTRNDGTSIRIRGE